MLTRKIVAELHPAVLGRTSLESAVFVRLTDVLAPRVASSLFLFGATFYLEAIVPQYLGNGGCLHERQELSRGILFL